MQSRSERNNNSNGNNKREDEMCILRSPHSPFLLSAPPSPSPLRQKNAPPLFHAATTQHTMAPFKYSTSLPPRSPSPPYTQPKSKEGRRGGKRRASASKGGEESSLLSGSQENKPVVFFSAVGVDMGGEGGKRKKGHQNH